MDPWGNIDDEVEEYERHLEHDHAAQEDPGKPKLDSVESGLENVNQDGSRLGDAGGWQDDESDDEEAEREAIAFAKQQEENYAQESARGGFGRHTGPKCSECGSLSLDNQILTTFSEQICYACKKGNALFKMMSKTKAKEEYLITDDDMLKLKYLESSNPRRPGWSIMKLYLVKQIKQVALQRWGNQKAIEEEKDRRIKSRAEKRGERAKKSLKKSAESNATSALKNNIKRLRGDLGDREAVAKNPGSDKKKKSKKMAKTKASAIEGFTPINKQYHKHEYGEEKPAPGGGPDMFVKKCIVCDHQVMFEKL